VDADLAEEHVRHAHLHGEAGLRAGGTNGFTRAR